MSGAAAVPLFSVVVPAYNEAAGIAVTVDRLSRYLGSTPLSWEIVVVDDGSADATAATVEALAAANAHVRLVRGGRHGKGAACLARSVPDEDIRKVVAAHRPEGAAPDVDCAGYTRPW